MVASKSARSGDLDIKLYESETGGHGGVLLDLMLGGGASEAAKQEASDNPAADGDGVSVVSLVWGALAASSSGSGGRAVSVNE